MYKSLIKKIKHCFSGYQKGVVPKYLRERKEQTQKEHGETETGEAASAPPGHVVLPEAERRETLRMLRSSFGELVRELNALPVRADTLRTRERKRQLETRLARLEDGIKVFSRRTVFVKLQDSPADR